jgi:hypothetical protein
VHPHMLPHATGYKLAKMCTILDRWLTTWGMAACNRRHGIPPWRPIGLKGLEGLTPATIAGPRQ